MKRGQPVSLTKFVDDDVLPANNEQPTLDPLLSEIKRFSPNGTEDHKAAYTIPAYCLLALETTVALLKHGDKERTPWNTSIARVALWAFTKGIRQLGELPEVKEICDTREDLLRRGSSVTFLDWRYGLSNRGDRSVRLYLRYVDPADTGKASQLAVGLGLGQQASGLVATFALMSSLIDVPLAGEVPSQMERELAAFVDTLRERRRLVENLQQARELLAPMPRPARRSWRQIVDT